MTADQQSEKTGNKKTEEIDISPVKELVMENFAPGSPIREAIGGEPSKISVEAFLILLPVWLRLLKVDRRHY